MEKVPLKKELIFVDEASPIMMGREEVVDSYDGKGRGGHRLAVTAFTTFVLHPPAQALPAACQVILAARTRMERRKW